MKRFYLSICVLVLCAAFPLFGAEYEDGRIRLNLNPQLGRFSLYYMTDIVQKKYDALFMDQDPRTSVLTLNYNGKVYRLGESDEFKIRIGGTPQQPALIFESPFLTVTEEFTFIVTAGSPMANGVKITYVLENKTPRRIQAGLRFILDTKLGETSPAPFTTDLRSVEEEIVFTSKNAKDRYWISGGTNNLALMGSISANVDRTPDALHIANWKRLNEVPWSLDFVAGRKFNNPPYSIRDSAIAYYYEQVRIERGERSSFFLLLSSWDQQGFAAFRPSEGESSLGLAIQAMQAVQQISGGTARTGPAGAAGTAVGTGAAAGAAGGTGTPQNVNPAIVRSDYNALQAIIDRVNGYLESGSRMSDDEIASIEQDLARIKSRYNSP
ncbi:MAG: hypothetical protein LBT39_11075 [Treponema sp.]|jgi:hypothetical protein|nr:hypothetical protein [Treponema sp.]